MGGMATDDRAAAGTVVREAVCLGLTGEGGVTVVLGGEEGSAVCIARRSTEPRGGEEEPAISGDPVRRDAEFEESFDELRECDADTTLTGGVTLTGAGFDTSRERGEEGGEPVERDKGDAARSVPGLFDETDGELGRRGGVTTAARAVEVAWCLSEGGALAIAFAFARLAAIAAATLLFLVVGATTGMAARASGFGHAFSSCLRSMLSWASRITRPLSGQTPWYAQNRLRALCRTPALASPMAFLTDLSSVSSMPVDSILLLARVACSST